MIDFDDVAFFNTLMLSQLILYIYIPLNLDTL